MHVHETHLASLGTEPLGEPAVTGAAAHPITSAGGDLSLRCLPPREAAAAAAKRRSAATHFMLLGSHLCSYVCA